MNKKLLLKKLKKIEKVSLQISREDELLETVRSFPVLYDKSHEGFKEKDAVKNAWDGVAEALEFIQTGNYFYFNSFISFFIHLAKPVSA